MSVVFPLFGFTRDEVDGWAKSKPALGWRVKPCFASRGLQGFPRHLRQLQWVLSLEVSFGNIKSRQWPLGDWSTEGPERRSDDYAIATPRRQFTTLQAVSPRPQRSIGPQGLRHHWGTDYG